MSRFRRGQRGQPPPATYHRTVILDKPLFFVRLDDRDNKSFAGTVQLPTLNLSDVDLEAFRAAFMAVSEAVAKMARPILAKHQAQHFVSQSAERARLQNIKDMAENGPPDWWGVSMQAKMDAFPEPIEEEFPTHTRDTSGAWVKVVWFCDVQTRGLVAMVE